MRLIATSVVRDAPAECHGFVYVVDWDKKRILKRFQPPVRLPKLNIPRGGSRGYKGITFLGDRCYIGYYNSIFVYDANWNLVDTISPPLFASIHEIESDGEGIWVTSSGIDAVLKISPAGEVLERHFIGELLPEDLERVGIRPRPVDPDGDYRELLEHMSTHVAHPNGLSVVDGRPYVTLYRPGAVIGLNPFELVWRDDAYYGVHSGRVVDGGRLLYLAASFQSKFVGFDLKSGNKVLEVSMIQSGKDESPWMGLVRRAIHHPAMGRMPTVFILKHAPPVVRRLLPTSRPGWTRGIAIVDEDHFFGGSSSATISLINSKDGRIEDQLQMEQGAQHSIFAIAVDKRES